MMACVDCEEALELATEERTLLNWRGTRIGVSACGIHTQQIAQVFDLLNAMYDSAYQEAVTEMTANLLALRGGERP